jgi:hypothetical protein
LKKKQWLFIYLLFSLLLLELSLYGLLQTDNTYYLFSLFLSTSNIIYIVYYIHTLSNQKSKPAKDYYFYFINYDTPSEEDILFRQISKRM